MIDFCARHVDEVAYCLDGEVVVRFLSRLVSIREWMPHFLIGMRLLDYTFGIGCALRRMFVLSNRYRSFVGSFVLYLHCGLLVGWGIFCLHSYNCIHFSSSIFLDMFLLSFMAGVHTWPWRKQRTSFPASATNWSPPRQQKVNHSIAQSPSRSILQW